MSDTPATSGLTPYINVDGAAEAMDFYIRAFGAIERGRNTMGDDKRIIHGHVEVNGAPLYLSDFFPDHGFAAVAAQGYNLHLQVDDAQQWWDRAVAAGCTIVQPLKLEFWGDTYGQLKDPFGVTWAIGQSKAH
ncbi:glyoxalase [Devosia epidermidihirudinis]|uniref:Glyoxalase n=1 Tax=Devosia epidermidihirudinis TaxID=1293439 RepID=A0A0F5Q5I3_9HYPH|nr:VOC family protein [Devosia epidermidihirudinis]KKC35901.1 glyoxalase [Devosia epidermidihirudinis]